MGKFTEAHENGNVIIKYDLDLVDEMDTTAADKLGREKIPGVAPIKVTEQNGKKSISAIADDYPNLVAFSKKEHNKADILRLMDGLIKSFSIGPKGIQISYIQKEADKIFVNPETLEVICIAIPVKGQVIAVKEIAEFFRNVLAMQKFSLDDKDNYVARIFNEINGYDFSLNNFGSFIKDMMNQAGVREFTPGAPAVSAPNPGRVNRMEIMRNRAQNQAMQFNQGYPMPQGQPFGQPGPQGQPLPNGQPIPQGQFGQPGPQGQPVPNGQPIPQGQFGQPRPQGQPVPNGQPIPQGQFGQPRPQGQPFGQPGPQGQQVPNGQPIPQGQFGQPRPHGQPAPNGQPVGQQAQPVPNGQPNAPKAPEMPKPPVNGPQAPTAQPNDKPNVNAPEKPEASKDKEEGAKPPVNGPQIPGQAPQAPNMPKPPVNGPQIPGQMPQAPNMPKPPVNGPQIPGQKPQAPNMPKPPVNGPQIPGQAPQAPNMPKPPVNGPQIPGQAPQAPNMPKPPVNGPQIPGQAPQAPNMPKPPVNGPQIPGQAPQAAAPKAPLTGKDLDDLFGNLEESAKPEVKPEVKPETKPEAKPEEKPKGQFDDIMSEMNSLGFMEEGEKIDKIPMNMLSKKQQTDILRSREQAAQNGPQNFGQPQQFVPQGQYGQPYPPQGRPQGQPFAPFGQQRPQGQPMPNGQPFGQQRPQGQPMPNGQPFGQPFGQPGPQGQPQSQPAPKPQDPNFPQTLVDVAEKVEAEKRARREAAIAEAARKVASEGGSAEVQETVTSLVQDNSITGGSKAVPRFVRTRTGENIYVTKPEFIIGKSKLHADYAIENNTAVSREHCIIKRESNGANYIVDNKSTNGTYVNGTKLEALKPQLLTDGTKVRLGDEEFIFRLRSGE